MIDRLLVIGVGLIGGSFALGLREAGQVGEVIGFDSDLQNLEKALSLGLIDRIATDLAKATADADLIFIAVPVGAMGSLIESLAHCWNSRATYTDAGSTKRDVLQALRHSFGEIPSNFIPGHPIAGSEDSGATAARTGLFDGRCVILTPEPQTAKAPLSCVEELWAQLGARVTRMSALTHDEILAATSHLPHVLSFVLCDLLGREDDERTLFAYAAGGLRDLTRIAGSDPRMWRDICLTNRDQLVPLIEQYRDALGAAAALMRSGDEEGLFGLFASARAARQRFTEQMGNKT